MSSDEERILAEIAHHLADDDPIFALRAAMAQRCMHLREIIPLHRAIGLMTIIIGAIVVVAVIATAGRSADTRPSEEPPHPITTVEETFRVYEPR